MSGESRHNAEQSLPSGWKRMAFDECVEVVSDGGRRLDQASYQVKGRWPVVDQGAPFVGGYSDEDALVFVGELPIIAFGDHTRRVKLLRKPFVVGAQGLKLFRPRLNIDPEYLAYALSIAPVEDRGYSRHFRYLRQLTVPIAPVQEQRRIVSALEEHLSNLERAMAGLERARRTLPLLRSRILSSVTGGEASGDRNLYSADRTFSLPSGWNWTTLGDQLSAIEAGASFKCEERPPELSETGVAKVSAVSWGTYDENESKTVRDEARIQEHLLVRPGDFLFSRANTIELVGACVIAGKVTRRVMLSDKILRLHFATLDPRWVLACLRSEWGRYEIERLATGNQESMRNIGQARIRAIRIPVPPMQEQQDLLAQIERSVNASERTAASIELQLARAARLRQSILKRAFDGKLVPQDPNDEPASVLLERTARDRSSSSTPMQRLAKLARSTTR